LISKIKFKFINFKDNQTQAILDFSLNALRNQEIEFRLNDLNNQNENRFIGI